MQTPMGTRTAEVTLAQNGDELSGQMVGDGQTSEISDGKIEDGRAKWNVAVSKPMPLTLSFDVAESDGNLAGTVTLGMFGDSEVTGTPV